MTEFFLSIDFPRSSGHWLIVAAENKAEIRRVWPERSFPELWIETEEELKKRGKLVYLEKIDIPRVTLQEAKQLGWWTDVLDEASEAWRLVRDWEGRQ